MKFIYLFITSIIVLSSCSKTPAIPKPNGYLKLKYNTAKYVSTNKQAPYLFEYSNQANFEIKKNYWSNIHYPKLGAEINITYQPVKNNLKQLIQDAEKLTYKHTLKANNIEVYPFENTEKKIYARLFELSGNVASPIQFQATDSVKNFLYGSLYFNTKPNYDSILPAIDYLKKDIQQIIESLEWRN